MIELQSSLRRYIPSLFELLEDTQISWTRISQVFQKEYDLRVSSMLPDQLTLPVDASFYDLISAALVGNRQAVRQLDYFDKLLQEISMRLNAIQKQQLKKTVYDILISTNHQYLHYFGELAILNQLLKTGDYLFEQTEFGLGNGKSADFLLINVKSKKPTLIEVVNIDLTKEISGDDGDIKKFLTKKLSDKVRDKSKGPDPEITFNLMPVVWGPWKDLQRIAIFYQHGNIIDVKNCLEACSYCSFSYSEHEWVHRFGTLSTLFPVNETKTQVL